MASRREVQLLAVQLPADALTGLEPGLEIQTHGDDIVAEEGLIVSPARPMENSLGAASPRRPSQLAANPAADPGAGCRRG